MSDGEATPENASLTLGFFGDQEIHRTHMRSLLDDFVEGSFKKSHRNAVVRCIVCVDPFTTTMSDLADWALTSGYQLGLIGHSDVFVQEEVSQLVPQAEGLVYKLETDSIVGRALTATLARFDENRLILVADPDEDDDAYDAFIAARSRGVPVRSLLKGLERVIMDVDDEDQEQPAMHLVEDEEADFSDDGVDEDDDIVDRDEPPDLDELAEAADEQDINAQEELSALAQAEGIDSSRYTSWAQVVIAMRGGVIIGELPEEETTEATVEAEPTVAVVETTAVSPNDDGYFDIDAVDKEETGPEEVPEEEKVEPVAPAKWTQKQLERMDMDQIKEAGAAFGILPGRGMKHAVFMRRILEAQEGKPVKIAAKKRTAKKATAKRAAKKAPAKKAKKAPAKRAPAAKKTAKRTTTRRTAPVRASAPSSNGVDRVALRSFIKAAQAALAVAEQLS